MGAHVCFSSSVTLLMAGFLLKYQHFILNPPKRTGFPVKVCGC